MRKGICVLGAFSFNCPSYDGQTIKTRNLLSLLKEKNVKVDFFDTLELKSNKLQVINLFWKVITCKILFYLPAQNNLQFLFPRLFWLTFLFRIKVHYFVIGGWLVEFLEDKPSHMRKLSRIAGIHCETHYMKDLLEESYGFTNVDVFPNFRINSFTPHFHHEEGKLKLVFMARVIKMKGLDLIFHLGDTIIKQGMGDRITIDFYGPQQNEDDDVNYFNQNIIKYPFMNYHGPLEPSDIYITLEKYDVMLLPTHFYTEGLPGSILDAYISGIPVVVTKWKHATEFVEDGESGIIIPFEDDGSALVNAVMDLYDDTKLLNHMKMNAHKRWHNYSAERAWTLIKSYINHN